MISIVLYGRNDSYGYNLHKRAALSLNCMAEVLTGPKDEILFVDYNTPDDYPTFPEAIADTLTERARRLIRIFRVWPEVHARLFATRTHLKALEPVSRNVAVRRSNPANRWILSTNTDMIFVPHQGMSLTDLVTPLDGGFYCAPRMEIPETLWENFDRLDAPGVINQVRRFGVELHLNEIVRGSDDILYDGPGDFQLIRRDDLFRIDGFHEEMILGWHVDANISRRLKILYERVGDAAPFTFGYHCDHTRQVTAAHSHKSLSNDCAVFVTGVMAADIPQQRSSWGLPDGPVEEIRLDDTASSRYLRALQSAINAPLTAPLESAYRADSYNREPAAAEHVLPFLLDLFSSRPRDTRLVWLGMRDGLFQLFSQCWADLGFVEPISIGENREKTSSALADAGVIVVNFGVPEVCSGATVDQVTENYWAAIRHEAKRLTKGAAARPIITVNAIHNSFEGLVLGHLSCAKTPFSARLRHGYLLPDAIKFPIDWTDAMLPGNAGRKRGNKIVTNGNKGHIAYGPYRFLAVGEYQVKVNISALTGGSSQWFGLGRLVKSFKAADLRLEIVIDEEVRATADFRLARGSHELELAVRVASADSLKPVQVRLVNLSTCSVHLNKVILKS